MNPGTIRLLNGLQGVKRGSAPDAWVAFCPGHEDKHRSLSVAEAAGTTVVHCHAGCTAEVVVTAAGMALSDLFADSGARGVSRTRPPKDAVTTAEVAAPVSPVPQTTVSRETVYESRDLMGVLWAEHIRREHADGSKSFGWRRNGKPALGDIKLVDLPLYGIRRLAFHDPGAAGAVVVTEGEKAADSLWDRGIPAVGTMTGASVVPALKVLILLAPWFVYLWPDNDAPGRKHMDGIARVLAYQTITWPFMVHWAEAPEHGDAADYVGDFALLGDAHPWEPAEKRSELAVYF